ncbi:hypothetical protein K490DRAFT_57689 [Saccharata proteae CBS 121410]|uniref:BTB domain-containing protein n=1 Tax=Saccharata proteae CBS 121410 TaxID=1314787 RepID=A0A9P4LW76_9PEZI|nr:hypothetical protein K490DRAFT_57689 [Saccharata proteae CBS 121410]
MAPSARPPAAKNARIVPVVPLAFTRPVKPKQPVAPADTTPDDQSANTNAQPNGSTTVTRASPKDSPQAPPTPNVETSEAVHHGEDKSEPPATGLGSDDAVHLSGGEENSNGFDGTIKASAAIKVKKLTNSGQAVTVTAEGPAMAQESMMEPLRSHVPELQGPVAKSKPQRPPFELPPPFYPSGDRSTPNSTTSSTFGRIPPPNPVTLHHPRPSVNGGIVFGGLPDSSSVSPAPPVANGSMPYPAPPPGFLGANFMPPPPANFFAGHAHHFSEPNGHVMHPSVPVGMTPQGNFGFRRDQPPPQFRPAQSWLPPNGPLPHRPELFTSRQAPGLNGNGPFSRPGSQASSPRALPVDQVLADGAVKPHLPSMQTNGAPAKAPAQFGYPAVSRDMDMGLKDYLAAHFSNRDFADYFIKIFHGADRVLTMALPGHGLMLARSPRLAQLMLSASSPHFEDGMRVLDVPIADRFFDGYMFAEALKHLYGQDLLNTRNVVQGLQPFNGLPASAETFGSPQQRMRHTLAYAAAGFYLQVPRITCRGLDVATDLLRWDNLEVALAFAMDGGLDSSWRTDDASEDRNSASSTGDDALSRSDSFASPSYGQYSTQFLQTIIGFIIHNFPKEFELDTSAPQLVDIPRLPIISNERPNSRNPRLSTIRFGEVPVESGGPSRYVLTLLSSVLVSLPFTVLKALLEDFGLCSRVGRDRLPQLMQSVIDERESRRTRALKHRNMYPVAGDAEDNLKHNLMWIERVEQYQQHASGFRVARTRQGVETPGSTMSIER